MNPQPCSFLRQGFAEEWAGVQTLFDIVFEDEDLLVSHGLNRARDVHVALFDGFLRAAGAALFT
jgi:hypothetical protein